MILTATKTKRVVHRVAAQSAPRVRKRKTTLSVLHHHRVLFLSLSLLLLFYSLALNRNNNNQPTSEKNNKQSESGTHAHSVYLGYRINPKLFFFCLCFFVLSLRQSSSREREKKNAMNTLGGGGTGGGREQQHTRNQATVGSGDNGGVVPHTIFSSKQSKTSTVTITGACSLYISQVRSFFDSRSLSRVLFTISLSRMTRIRVR